MAQPLASASTSSSVSSHGNCSYHIFINHRGSDVKKTFASHLYHRLLSYGFRVFLDQPELQRGEEIDSQIKEAIATASVHVAILSSGYAQSRWCLDELVLMLESKESRAATVIPVFYNVKPSDLRWTDKKRGYAEAFLNHEEKGRYSQERLAGWRKSLFDVSHISGFELEACNGDEGVLVDEVVRQVQKKVRKAPLPVATYPTGLEEKLQQLERTVLWEQQHSRGGPNIVGIVGLGGVGKSTLAKFFFNTKRSDYQHSCFLRDVREAAARCRLPSLQSELYKDLTGGDQVMHNVDEGIATLKDRLSSCQSLVVLDDVDDAEQLGALFSPLKDVLPSHSLIVLTSRNRDILRKSARIEESSIYMMTGLDPQYSQQLFCSHAFNHPYPTVEYEDLVGEFLKACQGLPLSLKVIGALLYSESREYWEDQLRKLSQVLPTEIQSSLKISYDSLDKEEKEMFLDIACFFIGIQRDTAINVWDGSGWNGSLGLRTLESKCLVTFDGKNCLRMHDHLRDLGRELAELPEYPRRLWRPTDSLFRNVHSTVRGLTMIQQGYGESSQSPSEFNDRIVDMSGLQLLRAPADCLERIFKVIRHPELLWLRCEIDAFLFLPSWVQRYNPSTEINSCLSSWIPIKNLRVLELVYLQRWHRENSRMLGTLWNTEYEVPVQLRELNIGIGLFELPKSIGQLKYLQKIELHDFRGTLPEEFFHLCSLKHLRLRALMESLSDSLGNFTSLQHIDLSECEHLQALPPSFGNLAMLQHIDLSGCWKLQTLPASIGNLKQVQYINLSSCNNLQRLPQSFGDLTNLQKVILKHCWKLKALPDSMNLIRLKHLDLSSCSNLILTGQTLENVSTLERLDFSWCDKIEILPSQVTRQQFLEELILRNTNLKELPNAIADSCIDKCMPRLKRLHLVDARITEISFGEGVCPVLEDLELRLCDELVEVGGLPTTLTSLNLLGCCALKKIRGLRGLAMLTSLDLSGCCALKKIRGLRGLARLRSLSMEGCIEIKDLADLDVRELDNLTYLDLKECAIGGVLPFASVENVGGDRRLLDSSIDKCMLRLEFLHLSKTRITEISFGEGVCPALEHLWLEDCAELVEVGALPTTLTYLSLKHCCALKKLRGLRGLANLRSLDMRGCIQIEDPRDLGVRELDNLTYLDLSECAIGGVLPFASVENVGGDCRLLDSSVDKCMFQLSSLILSKTRITEISFGEGVCPALEYLWLEDCAELVEVGALPTTLTYLSLMNCCALKKLRGFRGLAKLQYLIMAGCCAVEELPGLETLISLQKMFTSECENMKRILELAEAANPESDVLKRSLIRHPC